MSRCFFAILPVILVLTACAPERVPTAPSPATTPPAPRSDSHLLPGDPNPASDPALEDFLRRAEFLLRRFAKLAPSVEAVDAAVASGEDGFFALLGLDPEEGRAAYRELQLDAQRLLDRHPPLRAELDALLQDGAPPCELWELEDLARRVREGGVPREEQEKNPYIECRTFPYVASLVLCTATGNALLYAACAAVAMCNFCSGALVSAICGS